VDVDGLRVAVAEAGLRPSRDVAAAMGLLLDDPALPAEAALRALRTLRAEVPLVLVLTARAGEAVWAQLVEAGADDVLSWPEGRPLLGARLRRLAPPAQAPVPALTPALGAGAGTLLLRADARGRVLEPLGSPLDEGAGVDLVGQRLDNLVPAGMRGRLAPAIERVLATGAAETLACEGAPASPDEGCLAVRVVRWGPAEVLCICEDRSAQRELEQRLQLSERMASVGLIAAGVVHEISTPLAFMTLSLEALMGPLAEGGAHGGPANAEGREAAFEAIQQGVGRIQRVVRDLSHFALATDVDGPVDLHQVLEASLQIADHHLRHHAQLRRDFHAVPAVRAGEARLGQVFLNLLLNAVQGLPAGQADHLEVAVSTHTDRDGWAVVEVRELGRSTLPSKGLGPRAASRLGLQVSYNIVRQLGGQVDVEQPGGESSLFRVRLPPAVSPRLPRPVTPPMPLPPPHLVQPSPAEPRVARRRLMLVDDELVMVKAMRRLLQLEHEVEAFAHPHDALARLLDGAPCDVLLCDLMMPQMSGMEFYAALKAGRPELLDRIVFMTGGAFTPAAQTFLRELTCPVLQKPFTRAMLDEVLALFPLDLDVAG
jgi:signal transduction histidine kinase